LRNGNRWRFTAINLDGNRLAARRLHDHTVAELAKRGISLLDAVSDRRGMSALPLVIGLGRREPGSVEFDDRRGVARVVQLPCRICPDLILELLDRSGSGEAVGVEKLSDWICVTKGWVAAFRRCDTSLRKTLDDIA
jgi:hypothetical protein